MSVLKNRIEKMMVRIAEKSLQMNANSTTCAIFYQPKIPANLNLYKKREK